VGAGSSTDDPENRKMKTTILLAAFLLVAVAG
jgi:hypothetical protein